MNTRWEVSSTTHANLSATAHNVQPRQPITPSHPTHSPPMPRCHAIMPIMCRGKHRCLPAVVLCHGDVGLYHLHTGEWVSGESRTCTGGLAHGVICVSLIG